MNKVVILFLLLIGVSGSAQNKWNLFEIHKNVQDSTSAFFYEKLVYTFIYRPTSLDIVEAQHLYYGQSAVKNKKNGDAGDSFFQLIRKDKCKEAVPEGEKILKTDPVNMEVLGLIMRCYSLTDKENSMLPLRGLQFKTLVNAVLSSKEGSEKHKTYTVMKIADEYIIAGILNIDLSAYRRKTEKWAHGMTDHWKKGKKKISFQVIYPKTEAE